MHRACADAATAGFLAPPQADVSWRVTMPSPLFPLGIPTLMSGSGYAPQSIRLDYWCMSPGVFTVHLYDRNVDSAANASIGWDGGRLLLTDVTGCTIDEMSIGREEKYADADIHTEAVDVTIPLEGAQRSTAA